MAISSSLVMITAEGKSSLLPNCLPQKPQAFAEWPVYFQCGFLKKNSAIQGLRSLCNDNGKQIEECKCEINQQRSVLTHSEILIQIRSRWCSFSYYTVGQSFRSACKRSSLDIFKGYRVET